ncbi:MAG TPA: ABC transporter permease subunit [Streptosporangiaceae bacterium]|jgi:ABC-type transport system involved in multi-copper enzyme maturation permease subunit|nr:ABC transporter permease subunit [Streptosporangiaceae bacterium]
MSVMTPYRSELSVRRDGFAQLLRAEWTKFRTVRGWVIGVAVAALLIVGLGALTGANSECGSQMGPNAPTLACPAPPTGPGGEWVSDSFYFVRQPLAGDGSITVRVTSLTGLYSTHGASAAGDGSPTAGMTPGVQPWSKAGIIIKASTRQGSAYAAMMVTGSHGVRMQWDFTHDVAGQAGRVSAASPRWLRLTRDGDTITGYDSTDGAHWTQVGTTTLAGLPSTAQAGLFAASPGYSVTTTSLGGGSSTGGPTLATAAFDQVSRQGTWPADRWTGQAITGTRDDALSVSAQGLMRAGGRFTVSGSGDIAPAVGGPGSSARQTLGGTFAALIAVVVIGVMFITSEYRRGLIHITFTASPRRGRVLAAKAVVLAAVTFAAGLVAVAVVIPVGEHLLHENGNPIYPVPALTEARIVAGTAALLAVAAVLALAVGTLLRRGAGAVTAVIAGIVLPYLLAVVPGVLPASAAAWLVRVSPAAAFAIQQSVPQYAQVTSNYSPSTGYFPLAPWAGFAVLCAWTAAALVLALFLLRRRDA